MGLGKLNEIVKIYSVEGKSNLAVSVISNGSLPTQRSVVGRVSTIENLAKQENILAPAIIVLGDVVSLQNRYHEVLNEYVTF